MTDLHTARVLVVEHSATASHDTSGGIAGDARITVVGAAKSADEAVAMAELLKPDVVTVSLALPHEQAISVIERILKTRSIPIIALSSLQVSGTDSVPFRALAAGASDLLVKPVTGVASQKKFFADLNERVISLASAHTVPLTIGAFTTDLSDTGTSLDGGVDCVAIGASTGGPPALVELLKALGPDFTPPIVIVQHIAAPFVDGLVRWLEKETPFCVQLAKGGMLPEPRHVYVAPGGVDLVFGAGGRLQIKPASHEHRGIAPSADLLFESAAEHFKSRCAGVLLTGMGRDGAVGLLKMRTRGAKTFGQDEKSCIVFGMPAAAGRLGAVEAFAEPKAIGAQLRMLAARAGRMDK